MKPARICARCKMPIELHHKFFFKTTKNRTVIEHRNCKWPHLYLNQKGEGAYPKYK